MKKSKKQKIIIALAGSAAFLMFVLATAGLYREKRQAEEERQAWELSEQKTGETGIHNTVEFQGKTYKRNTYVKAILCMGVDRQGDMQEKTVAGSGGQADGIFLVAQDTARDEVKVLLLPRDTMTPITLTDLSGNVLGQDVQHLTLAYGYGDGRDLSCQYMVSAVSQLLGGLSIDGYMAISMGALPILNDVVGGVTVKIQDAGLSERDSSFELGKEITLKGKQAETYLRYRDIKQAQSALDRTERQKEYMKVFAAAFRKKASSEEGLAVKILEEIQPYLVTNLSKDQYLNMTMAFLNSSQNIDDNDLLTLPGEGVETGMYDEFHPDALETQQMILDLFYRLEE